MLLAANDIPGRHACFETSEGATKVSDARRIAKVELEKQETDADLEALNCIGCSSYGCRKHPAGCNRILKV